MSIDASFPSEGAAGASYRPSSQLYLQLARAYGALGHPDWALQVYTLVRRGWLRGYGTKPCGC